jgi:predicted dehydrogenase
MPEMTRRALVGSTTAGLASIAEDVCAFTLRFPSGVIANCSSGYSFHETRTLRLMGTEGSVAMDPAFSYDNLAMRIARRAGMSSATEERRWPPKNQFALEMDAYTQAIREGRTPLTPGEEGLQDQRIMEAIYQAASGGGVVRMEAAAKLDSTRGPAPVGAG